MTLTRRSFMQRSGAGGVAVLGASSAATLLTGCPDATPNSWLDSHRRDTLNAFCDTVLPNENGDGGREARGLEIIFDPYYAENGWIDEAVSELDGNSWNGNFSTLSLADRTSVLNNVTTYDQWYSSESQQYRTIFQGMVMLTKLAWFGGLITNVGTNYLGYPGPADRYQPLNGAMPPAPSPAFAGSASGNYYQPNPLQILDNTVISSWIYVSGTGTIRDLSTTVVIQHTYQGDLTVNLYSPAGTAFNLWNRGGGSNDDLFFINTPVTAFNGQAAQGWWRLEVGDWAGGDTGWIHQFAFNLTAR